MPRLSVVDALHASAAPTELEVDESTTLADLRALILSLALESSTRALNQGHDLKICHDGIVLGCHGRDEHDVNLEQLGVIEAPVVVVLSHAPARPPLSATSVPKAVPLASSAAASVCQAATAASVETDARAERQAAGRPQQPIAATTPEPAVPGMPLPADAVCRICFGGAFENGAGRLISPCLCSGSMRYVHVSCLNDWRAQSANPRSFYQCDQCHYQYNLQRTQWAAILESERFVKAAAAVLLISTTLLAAAVLAPLGVAHRFYRLVAFHPAHPYHTGKFIASLWCWQLDALVAGLLGVAVAGVAISARERYLQHRHMQHSWLFGVITAMCTHDERIFRVFALFGYIHGAKIAVRTVEHFAKLQLTKWGTMILEVQREAG